MPGLDFDVALFYLNVQGRLIPYELEEDGPTYYRSAGQSTHRGLEAAASWRFRPALTLQLTYTAGQFTFEDEGLEGNRLPGVPDQRFYAHLQGERRGFWGRVAAEAVGAYFTDDANEARNDGYALLDVHVGHEGLAIGAARLQPFAEVDNLLDARYNGSVIVNAFGGRFFRAGAGADVPGRPQRPALRRCERMNVRFVRTSTLSYVHTSTRHLSSACTSSIPAVARSATPATPRRGASLRASGRSSRKAIHTIAPAAKPSPTGRNGAKASTAR